MRFLLVLYILCSFLTFGQIDSVQNVQEVFIISPAKVQDTAVNSVEIIDEDNIRQLQPVDVGDILQKFGGVNLKSYGGLGGLKTIATRSLGANHTAFVIDGFPIVNNQTGQINLGQLQAENIIAVYDTRQSDNHLSLPVSSRILGSSFFIQSFENTFSEEDTLALRAGFKFGSFDRYDTYLSAKWNPGKLILSLFGSRQSATGAYPYNYLNGSEELKELRKNNDYLNYNYGGTIGFNFNKVTARVIYKGKQVDQGLPGAVVFYNQTQDERLKTNVNNLKSDIEFNSKKMALRLYGSYDQNEINYLDPTYLNSNGSIDVIYMNRTGTAGVTGKYLKKRFTVEGGVEEQYAHLEVNDTIFAKPIRSNTMSFIASGYRSKKLDIAVQLTSQYVDEKNRLGVSAKDQFRVNPYGYFGYYPLSSEKLKLFTWYRNSFRLPTFNELYYNNIGNNNLQPEEASQFDLGISSLIAKSKVSFDLKINGFFNLVKNKIQAIPTKNLFVWSMQNIGEARIYGIQADASVQLKIKRYWKIHFSGNYTFQHALDYTDPNGVTFRQQLAYTPIHTGNADLTIKYRKLGIRVSNSGISKRYALNENITANEVKGFWITDLGLFYRLNLGTKNSINLQATVKNITNQSYAYIRSFVMPGVNYLISINYAFN